MCGSSWINLYSVLKRTFSEPTLCNAATDCSGKYHWVDSSQDKSLLLRNIIHARDEGSK